MDRQNPSEIDKDADEDQASKAASERSVSHGSRDGETSVHDDPPPLLHLYCAGALEDGDICPGDPCVPCPHCGLVSYCDEKCRLNDWPCHKNDCLQGRDRVDLDPVRASAGETSSAKEPFWAPYAAIDLLNLEQNEGTDFDDWLRMWTMPDFGLRHVIYTVTKLPDQAAPKLAFHVAERDPVHLARTVLPLLFLLGATSVEDFDPTLNAEVLIHLWYSAKQPTDLWEYFKKHVSACMAYIDRRFNIKFSDNPGGADVRAPASLDNGSFKVTLHLRQRQWDLLKRCAEGTTIKPGYVAITRSMGVSKYQQSHPRLKGNMQAPRAESAAQWHRDGLLLPYNHPRDGFKTVNPVFFRSFPSYPLSAVREPYTEWPMELLDFPGCPSPNDLYGKMFLYLRDLLVRFQHRASKIRLTIDVHDLSLKGLGLCDPSVAGYGFDRVEAGSLWKNEPQFCLGAFQTLLMHSDESPFATGLVMCRDGVTENLETTKKDIARERSQLYEKTDTVLDEHAPPILQGADGAIQNIIRRQTGLLAWRNWDKFFDHHLRSSPKYDFMSTRREDPRASAFKEGFGGLRVRSRHVVTKRWPSRLVHSRGDEPSLGGFNRWLAWGDNAPERWMEWFKVKDYHDWAMRQGLIMTAPADYLAQYAKRSSTCLFDRDNDTPTEDALSDDDDESTSPESEAERAVDTGGPAGVEGVEHPKSKTPEGTEHESQAGTRGERTGAYKDQGDESVDDQGHEGESVAGSASKGRQTKKRGKGKKKNKKGGK